MEVFITMNRLTISLALLFISGCSFFEDDDQSQVQLSIQGNSPVLRQMIHVQLTAPAWSKSLSGKDFGSAEWPNYTLPFETPKSGTLLVRVSLSDSAGQHVSSGSIALDIRSDWRWGVDIFLSNRNPTEGCFGCFGYHAFEADSIYQETPTDSLYLVWGGNSIKHPVIY